MKFLFTLFLLGSFLACNNFSKRTVEANSTNFEKPSDDEETASFKEIYDNYILGYSKLIDVDTAFTINNDKYLLRFHYQCLFDSSIVVPKEYFEGELDEDFVTHRYISEIEIIRNNKTIYNSKVIKEYFDEFINEELKQYGVFLYPYFYKYDEETQLFFYGFSISIPLTDIGKGVYMAISLEGKTSYLSEID